MKRKGGKLPGAEGVEKPASRTVRLKDVADHLGLSPATVSIVLNRSPVATSIPAETQRRVFDAARELDYRPNFLARSLRSRRTFSVGVLVPEISEGYAAGVMSGVESHLVQAGYFYLLASHQSRTDLLEEYLSLLQDRLVEGFILVAARLERPPKLPTVIVSGHQDLEGVTNVVVDQDVAADLALGHLTDLGHRRIAFFRGPENNADANDRWRSIHEAAAAKGIEMSPGLLREMHGESYGEVFYREGYRHAQDLLQRDRDFTALFAFNDISAIGAMRAILDAGLRVPDDISIVGFDDIQSASFLNPSLTTIRQPLQEIGKIAGSVLLSRLAGGAEEREVMVCPELVVRGSTGPARDPRPARAS